MKVCENIYIHLRQPWKLCEKFLNYSTTRLLLNLFSCLIFRRFWNFAKCFGKSFGKIKLVVFVSSKFRRNLRPNTKSLSINEQYFWKDAGHASLSVIVYIYLFTEEFISFKLKATYHWFVWTNWADVTSNMILHSLPASTNLQTFMV